MSQFDVFENTNPSTQMSYPYLVDIQSNTLSNLQTTVVIPLITEKHYSGKPLSNLHPSFEIFGKEYIGMTTLIAGVDKNILGDKITSLSQNRDLIISALDFMITGICPECFASTLLIGMRIIQTKDIYHTVKTYPGFPYPRSIFTLPAPCQYRFY
ncbi:MAG: CcdB family protein [Nitrosomonas sp.]|nr:CcdB family protein [Nitrosomonas sp.]